MFKWKLARAADYSPSRDTGGGKSSMPAFIAVRGFAGDGAAG